jgi:hypothetical protein
VPLKWKVTRLPCVEIRCRPVFHIVEYCEPFSLPVSNVNFTSAAENGLPSFHLMPFRSVTTWFLPTQRWLVASHGMYLSLSGSYRKRVSYRSPSTPVAYPGRRGLKFSNGPQAVPDVYSVCARGSASCFALAEPAARNAPTATARAVTTATVVLFLRVVMSCSLPPSRTSWCSVSLGAPVGVRVAAPRAVRCLWSSSLERIPPFP